jgi:hypothetical protein
MKRIVLNFIILSLLLTSCSHKAPDVKRVPILEVEGKFLYLDQIQEIIPPNVNSKDSLQIANRFIRSWVTDVLMYENAKRNSSNQTEIEDLVEGYRKSLTIHQYHQKLIEQRLAEPSEDEIRAFYEQYSSQLILKENVIKGILLVVPTKAPNIGNVRAWVQSCNSKSLENIEKYSIQNAISYDYFGDKWMNLSEVLNKIPVQVADLASFVRTNRFVEKTDSTQHYFLRILSYNTVGQVEPYEMAKDRIINILQNKRKEDFISNFETELYDDAVKKETVTFFKKK